MEMNIRSMIVTRPTYHDLDFLWFMGQGDRQLENSFDTQSQHIGPEETIN